MSDQDQAVQQAKRLIEQNIYAAIATADSAGRPWNSPVFVVYDDELNFYWASGVKSQHSQNIHENSHIFLVLFDSTVEWGKGEGVYIQARAKELTNLADITKACKLRYQRQPKANQSPSDFTGVLPRRVYRAVPEHIWINGDAMHKGYFVDGRYEVDLAALRAAR
ncbi:MAG TPA: pyridoxamine 5'-phosphate oxidase family protein [Candidatus Saccharimonadales bacterium]